METKSGDMGAIRDPACHCRKKIHVAKGQLELELARSVGDNKKRFFSNILMAEARWK